MTSVARICQVDGCKEPVSGGVWCQAHLDFWEEHREPENYLQIPLNGDQYCSIWWCDREPKGRGMCSMHLTREKKGADMDLRPLFRSKSGVCCIPGCGGKVLARAYCGTHYSRARKGSDVFAPLPPKHRTTQCTIAGCEQATKSWNLCSAHYSRKLRGMDLTPPVVRKNQFRDCSVENCDKPHQSQGGCVRHYRQRRVYKVSYEWISENEARGCAICGQGRELQVDHDHSCCEGDVDVCGRCNRGMLCFPCNAGLGQFRDSVELLGRAATYLGGLRGVLE